MSTSPDITGPLTLDIISFSGLVGCAMEWRKGDTQPLVKLQVLQDGVPVNLENATATLNFIAPTMPTMQGYVQSSVMTLAEDNETLTYERLGPDYTTVNAGSYEFCVTIVYEDGTGFTAPDNGELIALVNPEY